MARFGFCGGSYTSQSPIADAERTVNWYPELVESENGKSRIAMCPTMGALLFAATADAPMRQLYKLTTQGAERLFAAGGTYLWEIFKDRAPVRRGAIGTDATPAFIAGSQTQLAITAGGKLSVFGLADNSFAAVPLTGPVAQVGSADGYFIALLAASQRFQISGLLDGKKWDPIDIAQVSRFPDDVLAMLIDHSELWLFGAKQTIPYQDTGNPFFPWEPVSIGVIEQGIIAAATPQRLDNSVFWLGGDDRGSAIAWRAQGYTPTRVSTHAMETIWQTYARRDDAVAYTYQLNGHQFYVLRFPTALAIPGTNQFSSAAFAYDVSTGMWHDWTSWDAVNGIEAAHQSQAHAYCWGKHLVANPVTGNVDELSPKYNDDNGTAIKRIRRTPWINVEKERIYFPKLELDCEVGLGPIPPLTAGDVDPRPPRVMLRWSDDGTKTWSNEHWRSLGLGGQYNTRVRWLRLGQSRGRIFELIYTDPAPLRIVDAYLPPASDRISSQARKVA